MSLKTSFKVRPSIQNSYQLTIKNDSTTFSLNVNRGDSLCELDGVKFEAQQL